jgi:hypothetical protein
VTDERCYLCGTGLVRVSEQRVGKKPPNAHTVDHIPPKGLFPEPRPANLITVPCCYRCNQEHSDFDEQLRLLLACALERNTAGATILKEKVIGSTLARKRQIPFIASVLRSMRPVDGHTDVIKFSLPSQGVLEGIVRVTKGLLRKLHPEFDYEQSVFDVTYISPAEAADAGPLMKAISQRSPYDVRGDRVFEFWRSVDPEKGRGTWMLAFYEAVVFIVMHENRNAPSRGR